MEHVSKAKDIMNQINSVLVGKEEKVELVMITILAAGHLLLEDVPGVGKTTLANTIAKSLDLSFGRIQFTPDTLPSDVTGNSVYQMQTGAFHYIKGAVMNQIILADEINRTSPKTQASLLETMEEGQVTVDGTIYVLEKPFFVIATQNPIDFLGTYHLPEAQLDRFLMRISLGYPSVEDEMKLAEDFLAGSKRRVLQKIVDAETVLLMQEEVEQIYVHSDLIRYIARIMEASRNHEDLTLGASPRATLALIKAAQAKAYLSERDYVIPDDVQALLYPVLCHRLVLSMEAKMKKMTAEKIIKDMLTKIPVPILRGKF